MSALETDAEGVVVRCPACGKKNRMAYARLAEDGKCGACGQALPRVALPVEIASEAAFAGLLRESPVPVLVDFWAAWCGPCLMVAPELETVAERAAGKLVVAKVDTERLPNLSQGFKIASIPTMALFVGGREIGRTAGARPAEGIVQFVEQQLAELPRA